MEYSLYLNIAFDLFLGVCFILKIYEYFPLLSVITIVFGAFIQFRTSVGISYYNIQASTKSDKTDSEPIGMIMTYALLSGIAFGATSAYIYNFF